MTQYPATTHANHPCTPWSLLPQLYVMGTIQVIREKGFTLAATSSNATLTGTTVEKTAGGTAWGTGGAFSNESLNSDGFIQFQPLANNKNFMVGLSATDPDTNYTSIKYAIAVGGAGTLAIYENGVLLVNLGAYTTSDTFKVEVRDGQVLYKQNDTLLYTSLVAPTFPLHADIALYDINVEVDILAFVEVVSSLTTCLVFGFLLDFQGSPIVGADVVLQLADDAGEYVEIPGAVVGNKRLTETTNGDGYFEVELISSSEYTGTGEYIVVFRKTSDSVLVASLMGDSIRISVPDDVEEVNIASLI